MARKSVIYEQLNTKKIQDSPSTEIQTVQNPLNIEQKNAEYLREVALINQATFRGDSGPIPAETKIVTASQTDSGTKVAIYTPSKGETWQVISVYYSGMAGGSGSITQSLWFLDNANSQSVAWKLSASSDAAAVLVDGSNSGPTFDENITLQWMSERTSLSGGNIYVMLAKIR